MVLLKSREVSLRYLLIILDSQTFSFALRALVFEQIQFLEESNEIFYQVCHAVNQENCMWSNIAICKPIIEEEIFIF